MCIYIYAYMYKQFWLCKCMYKYICIYTCVYIFIYIYIYKSDVCLQIQHQDQITPSSAWMLRYSVLRKSKTTSLPHVCHDSFICVPWLIHMRAMTHSYVHHDSFWSQRLHHCHTCTPPHSLHRLYLRNLLLSANLSVHPILYIYIHAHICMTTPHTQNES